MLVLFDTNILLRWQEPDDPDQVIVAASARRLIQSGFIPCYTSQNLGEVWNVLTRPFNRNGFGLSPAQADRRVRLVESRLELLPDNILVHQEWRRLLVAHSISGVQVHDARLVASMHVHNVRRILTFNTRDFARFTGIEAVHPADFANTAS
jgi:predicted nucleic acid-binding protein